jgi:iron complex outermembrane receptor protein
MLRARNMVMCYAATAVGLLTLSASPAEAQTGSQTGATVGELVVTAQHREERLRDVPLSITAATGATLEKAGVTNSADLQKVTPGFMIYMYGGAPQPVIRGISSGGAGAGDSRTGAGYVDGVYQSTEASQLFDLPDIERVEILKGPQGTLFGRNAAGGAVKVITKSPSFTPTGALSASYGSFNDVLVKGFVSGPIVSDTLAGSLAAFYEKNDGWIHDVVANKRTGGLDSYIFRAKLLFKPTDDLKFTLTGYNLRRKNAASFAGNALNGNTAVRTLSPTTLIVTNPRDSAVNTPVGNGVRGYGVDLNAEYDTALGQLTSVTAYQDGHFYIRADADYTTAGIAFYDQNEPFKAFSEEVNFASRKFGRVSFTLGAFYNKSKEIYAPLAIKAKPELAPLISVYADARTEATAVFGEGYVDVTDHLQLIAGVRYSSEKKTTYAAFNNPNPPLFGKKTFKATTPRVSVKYAFNDYSNVYFTYSKGFKSGVFNPTGSPAPLEPEHVTAYEVGFKGRVTPQIELTAALFDYDYKNLQIQVVQSGFTGNGTQNAALAKIKGFEGDAVWTPAQDFTLRAGVSILDAKYGSFPAAVVNVPILLASGAICNCGNRETTLDISGNRIVRTPKWTANLTGEYSHEFPIGTVSASATVFTSGKWWSDITNRFGQPAYTTLDGQIGWSPVNNPRWKLSVWGKNLTNKTYFYSFFGTTTADGVSYAAPRSGGVRIDYAF